MNIDHTHLLRWVLVETSHPGNVGSAARALKTMGYRDLRLVNPKVAGIANQSEAISLASGACDILEAAIELDSLESAIQDCALVIGLSSRDREFGPPAMDWRDARNLITNTLKKQGQVALLFGPERTGLENHHLSLCTHRAWLDANPEYPSLNLAQAIMVCAFSLRETLLEGFAPTFDDAQDVSALADPGAVAAMLSHWKDGLEAIGYLDPANPKKLMPRLEALFTRSRLRKEEIDLLRGIAKQMILRK